MAEENKLNVSERDMEIKDNKNVIQKVFDKLSNKEEQLFSAERAWIETTYGVGSYKTIDKRIEDKQMNIKQCIRSKFCGAGNNNRTDTICYSSYHCVIDIEEDLANVVDEIFKPFINNGFKVINLSEVIDEIKDDRVYLVSWRNIFNQKK